MKYQHRAISRTGIYLLPNLLTTGGLFAGFYSIIAAMNGRYETAAISIFVAMIMDGLDGRVARLTQSESAFGAEYDSLADMVSFGIAPALVIYQWALHALGKIGWLCVFIFSACSALRLARFNTQLAKEDKRYFQGLPSPSAAGLFAGIVWAGSDYLHLNKPLLIIIAAMTVAAGILMVSNVRYNSFKQLDLKGKVPFVAMILLVLVIALISIDPPWVLFSLFFVFALSGPVLTLVNIHRAKTVRKRKSH